jgi:hypothetical protein
MENHKFKLVDFGLLFLPILFGFFSMLIWLIEIRSFIGWDGISWINTDLKAVYIVTLFAVLSYLFPILITCKPKRRIVFISILLLYFFSLFGFFVSKWIFGQLYTKIGDETHVIYVWYLIVTVTLVAAVFYFVKQLLFFKSEFFHIMTIVAVFISIIPASLISIEWVKGFATSVSFVESVKMGYPLFWLNVMLGWVSYAMVKKII